MILIFIYGIFCVQSGEQRVIQDCPDKQVLHVDPGTKVAFCCIPVNLPKGQEYVPCANNGTLDSTKICAEGLFQEDETTTESEATCETTLQCISKENRKISNCDEKGANCKHACVCNYQEGFCGTAYYKCKPFPNDCPKEYVQEDCSCNKSFPYGSSTDTAKTPGSDVISQRNSTVTFIPTTGQPKINAKNDTVPTVGDTNNTIKNNSMPGPGLEQEESGIPVLTVVGIVIGVIAIAIAILIAFVVVCYCEPLNNNLLCIIKWCRKRGQTKVPPPGKPTAEVKPLVHGLSQEDSDIHSINMSVEYGDAQDSQNVLAQLLPDLPIEDIDEDPPVPFEDLPIDDIDEDPPVPFEESPVIGPSMEGYVTLSTIPSNSFDSENTSVKQIESDQSYDNTDVKQVEDVTDQTEGVDVEENQLQCSAVNHQRGASDCE